MEENAGITVIKTVKDMPENYAPGDTSEQVYTISAIETGTYKFVLKSVHVWNNNTVYEKKEYIINIH